MIKFWHVSLVVGVLGILLSIIVFTAGMSYLWGGGADDYSEEENKKTGIDFFFICGPMMLLTSLIFLFFGILGWVRRKKLRERAEILKAYRRIKIEDFAKKIGKNEMDAEKEMMSVMEGGYVDGYIDRNTEEFFTKEFLEQTPNVRYGWKCDSCGAKNDTVILPGEAARCQYCNSPQPIMGGE